MEPEFLTQEVVKDTFITAIEQGISYWALIEGYNPEGITCKVTDEYEDGSVYTVTEQTIRQGYARAYSEGRSFDDPTALDAIEADIVVQLGLFGKVVYG